MQTKQEQLNALVERVRAFIQGDDVGAERFGELALDVFQFQFEHNPPYRVYCQAIGRTPHGVREWRNVPSVVTSLFKSLDFTVLEPKERRTVFFSSGTTQADRSRHFHLPLSLEVYEQSLVRWFKPFVLPERDLAEFILLSPAPSEAPNSSLVHMFHTVSHAFGSGEYFAAAGSDGSWHLDFDRLSRLAPRRPVVICGTAFSFVHLCDWAEQQGKTLSFPAGTRVFETGGYKGRSRTVAKADLHSMISRTLGVAPDWIISEYGMSELSSQAYDRVAGENGPRLFRFPPWVRVQIVNPETGVEANEGETGLIRVFDLANVASVMAVQTEDLGVRSSDGFELLGRAAAVEARGCSLMPA